LSEKRTVNFNMHIAGVMVYGKTRKEAVSKVEALALRVLADRIENGEDVPPISGVFSIAS
jgi:hypothetical protein